MELKTPLYDCHVAAGGKIVPFAGYLLPVQYTGVIKEHMAVRTACGLFDVSHMGEFLIKGADALNNVQNLFCNDFANMYDGQVRYSPMCNERGGIVDDVLIYKVNGEEYLLVVNAANRHKDAEWVKAHLFGSASFEDISDSVAQLALQGPKSKEIAAKIVPEAGIPKKYYSFVKDVDVQGIKCIVSRTGYTGEFGYEFYCAAADGPKLWDILLEAGKEFSLIPCGLGARDTLRLEAAMPLYGHELTDDITPLEAGLDFFVKLGKDRFIGMDAILAKGDPKVIRVGLKITGRGIAREHCDVYSGEEKIGVVTSGTHCPYLNAPVAMAMVPASYSEPGTKVQVDVRGRRIDAEVVPLPFYKRA